MKIQCSYCKNPAFVHANAYKGGPVYHRLCLNHKLNTDVRKMVEQYERASEQESR